MPDNSLSMDLRYVPIGGNFYDALLTSPDGSNKFYLTAAAEVYPGNCTNAAKTLSIPTVDGSLFQGIYIDVDDINYNREAYWADLRFDVADSSIVVIDAAPLPKAVFDVSPCNFRITHSWSAPYETSCPQTIGTLHISNSGGAGSKLEYLVFLSSGSSWLSSITPNSAFGIAGIVAGSDSFTPTNDIDLMFNCKVSGKGTYTTTLTIKAWEKNTMQKSPDTTVTVTVEVGP